ncbi:MAG: DUF1592 domain-containing protein, partial [Planctomycetes bacterium]|nr:DUF1592 domain-containing protein [Planctomycetota bacterium]
MRTHTHLWLDRSFLTRIMLPALVLVLSPALLAAAEARSGEQIYKQLCISCHGATGGGTKDHYPHPLMGDRSVAQLTKRIARSMPKDNPGTCVGDDAQKVAAYIYDAFYSRAAQARRQGPRVELTRLTVRQYRNVLADLVGSFRTLGRWDDQHGLHAEYRSSRRFRNANPGLVRLDPEVHFDFGTSSPDPEKLDPHQFSARWEGSVLAPETGDYEFIIRTDHAARLWVNNLNRPLVDAWVKSGKDTEYRASISLLGGRAYPLRLEFSKAKQGVDDSKKTKEKPPVPASIALLWKLPRRAEEVIPQRDLTPNRFPETFVVTTPFPPDDRSLGYERGTSISREWDQAATDAAIETAGYVVSHLQELAGAADNSPDRAARLREFCRRFAERAFRRPLTPQQQQFFIDRQFQPGRAPEIAVKRVVLLVLNAPQFLYQELDSKPDAYDVASRLSFGLWDSLPDQELLQAAAAGRLATREQVAHQVERMMSDLRTRSKVHEFFLQWLKIDQIPELSKDPKLFAGFDPALASDLRTSLDLFVEDVVWSPPSDFRRLLLGNELYLNGRLAQFYGAHLPPEAPFQKVSLESQARAGVLTHPYLLSVFAYTGT